MALAEIASLVPPISISIAGILDVDINLGGHTSVGLPFTSTKSTTHTTTHTTPPTSPVAETTATTSGSPVIVTSAPNTSPDGRTTLPISPTVIRTPPTTTPQQTTSPLDSPSASPIRIVTSVPGAVINPSQGSSVGGAGSGTSTLTRLSGIPVAAAEGLPTVGVTIVNGVTIRPTAGITELGQASVTSGSFATNTSTNALPTNSPNRHRGAVLSSGAIAAIIVCLLLILLCFIVLLLRRGRTRRDQDTIRWRLRSYGANSFGLNAHSALSIPFHSRKRSLQEAASMLAPTSPRSPTFVIRPMSQAHQSTPSILTDTTRSLYYDARTSISSAVSAAESHHSSEETWQTAEHTLHSEHSSLPLKPEIHIGFNSTSPANQVIHIPSPISIPNSAFRLTTTPIPPLPPLPSSPPPLPPSPRTPKFPVVTLNPFDHSQSPTRPAFEVKYTDPFQDPMD